ncbi:hypothetical protein LLG88_13435 [bacterium]|nr:hypothetical protein [bacterium]
MPFNETLQCELVRSFVDCEGHVACYYLPWDHCTDMTGAVRMAQAADPAVDLILVVAGEVVANVYVKRGKSWAAVRVDRSTDPELVARTAKLVVDGLDETIKTNEAVLRRILAVMLFTPDGSVRH